MSRKPYDPVGDHLEWLGDRMPSEARRESERDLSDYPLAQFLRARHRKFAERRRAKREREARK